MRFTIALCLGLLLSLNVFSQTKKNTSADIINKGIELHDESKYQEALDLYNQVSRNDSNYVWALVEKAITLNAMEQYQEVIKVCNEGFDKKTGYNSYFYNSLGTAYDMLGDKEKALETYQKALIEYPYSYTLYFNIGVTFEGLNDINSAIKAYKKAVELNIYYSSPHYQLGRIMYSQGKAAPAMYALSMYVLLDNQSERSRDALGMLQNMANGIIEVSENILPDEEPLEELELIIRSKLALSKKYKALTDLDDPYIKQLQVLCEKTPIQQENNNFWLKNYAPYFRNLLNSKFFEYHSYFIFKAYLNDMIDKWLSKNKSKNEEFLNWARGQLNSIRQYTVIDYEGKPYKAQQWFYDNNAINAIGNAQKKEDKEIYTGPWTYMFNSGKISTKGYRDQNGYRQGEWIWYHPNGIIEQKGNFINDKWNGPSIAYHENGNLRFEANYKNDSLDGDYLFYSKTGQLTNKVKYKNGKIVGKETYYHENGNISSEYYYNNGIVDSLAIYYYPSGQLNSRVEVKNQERNGNFISYFENGNTDSQGKYIGNEPVGVWKWYYETGELMAEGNFNIEGKFEGPYTRYRKDGSIEQTESYKDNLLDGVLTEFNDHNKKFSEVVYKLGIIQSFRYFNPDNNEELYSSGEMKNNVTSFKSYFPNGILRNEGKLKVDKRDGTWNVYKENGALDYIQEYTNDNTPNKIEYYYPDKTIRGIEYTIEDMNEGEVTYYHRNGILYLAGNFVKNQKEGDWKYFNQFNKLVGHEFYLNDKPNGYQIHFHSDGKLFRELYYLEGVLSKLISYDTLGNSIQEIKFDTNTIDVNLLSFDGKTEMKGTYKNGFKNGKFISFFSDGTISLEQSFLFDKDHGDYKNYYSNGNIASEGKFAYGKREGLWKFYHKNGKIKFIKNYKNGLAEGEYKYYYDNGAIQTTGQLKDDLKEGEFIYYAPDGEIQIKKSYKKGIFLAYTFLNKNGEFISLIQLKNETGKVIAYYKNGNKSTEFELVNGEYQNNNTDYYSNGKTQNSAIYTNNELHGTSKDYYENGILKSQFEYQFDMLHGTSTYYYENGKIERIENYQVNERDGVWQYFDINGNLTKTEEYKYDRKIK